tara:strand:+ start:259 stop:417 length:159 start_codon:yes stop_codon:yes gene_type:complete
MKRKGNPHKDDPSNTPGEKQEPRGQEVTHIKRTRRGRRGTTPRKIFDVEFIV